MKIIRVNTTCCDEHTVCKVTDGTNYGRFEYDSKASLLNILQALLDELRDEEDE